MKPILRRLASFAATAAAIVATALAPSRAAAQVTPISNMWLTGTGSLSQKVVSGNTISGVFSTVTGGFLVLNTGGTLSLSAGTITGSAGIIPISLVSGAGGGSVTGMTLALGGALTGSLTNTASVPALTLTLSTFPAASISGTLTNGQLITPTISVGGTTITLGTGATTLNSLSLSSLTVSGAMTFSGVKTPVASTSYVLQINTVSGAISTTTASSGGGAGTVTQVTGTTGRVTVTNTTSTPVVTLPTTLTLSDTTLYPGTISGPTLLTGSMDFSPATLSFARTISAVTATASSGSSVLSVSTTTGLFIGMTVSTSSTGIPIGTTISAIGTGTVSLTSPATYSISGSTTSFSGGTLINPFVLVAATTSLSSLQNIIGGNPALNSASTASSNFGGYLQIGSLSNSSAYGYPGYTQQGYLVGTGMNQLPGGFTGPVDTISSWWRRFYGVITTSNSQLPVIHFGDSFGVQVWDRVDPQIQAAIGFAGIGGYDVSVSYSGTATTSTVGWTFNPAGTIETLTATNDAVQYYVSGGSNGMADAIRIFYAQKANGGTFKVQTASASPPAYTFGAFGDEAGYTAVSSSGSPTTAVITLTKSAGYAWKVQLVQTVSRSGGTTINFRPAFYSSSQSGLQTYNLSVGGISLSDSNTISTSYLTPFLASFAGGAPALITYHMSESNTFIGSALDTMKTLWSTSVSSTSWLIMGNPPNGTPGGAENNNPTTAQEVQNGYLSSFAQRNAQSGFQYYDIYGFMRNWLYLDAVQMGGDGTHISNTAFDLVATKLIRDMGITGLNTGIYPGGGTAPSTIGPAMPQSVYGPMVTVTGTTAFTLNPLGSYSPNYFTAQLATDHDQNYNHDGLLFRLRNYVTFTSPTDSTSVLTLTSSGGAQFGPAGSSIYIAPTALAGFTRGIVLDQSGYSGPSSVSGSPVIGFTLGNNDTGFWLGRGGSGAAFINTYNAGANAGYFALNVANASGTLSSVLTATSGGVLFPSQVTITSLTMPMTLAGLLTVTSSTQALAITGTVSMTGTVSVINGASSFIINKPAGSGATSNVSIDSDNNRILLYRGNGDNGAWIDRGSTYGNGVLGIVSASQSSTVQGNIVLAAGSTSGAITRAFEVAWDSATLATPLKINGSLSVSSTLSVSGAATHASTLFIAGASTFASVFGTSISNSGTLSTSGATTLGSTLVVGGLTTLNSGTLAGTFSLTGPINLTGLASSGNTGYLVVNTTSGALSYTTSGPAASNAIALLITGSASPAANSASLSVPSGFVWTVSATSPVTLSMGTGLNTFAGGLSSSGVLNVTNATASTGTTSGAGIIAGGLGVQGALYGTTATFTGTMSAASASFTAATFAAGLTGSFSSFAALNTSSNYTLTTSSPRRVLFTGLVPATTHTISVDATTQQIGAEWRLVNTGTVSVTLKGNGGGLLGTAYTNSITLATLNSVTTTSGSYTVQRIPLLDSSGRLAPGNGTFLGPKYLDLNNGYIASGFTVSGSVELGSNNLTSSGTIAVNTLTASSLTASSYLFSPTITTSSLTTTGSVNLTGGTLTISSLPTSGATDFVGMINPGSQVVELSVVDAASLLGLPSSRTVKQDIVTMNGSDATATLSKIEVVRYKYTAASGQDATKPHIGFIAEDVANVFPEGGNTVGPKSKLVPSVSDRDLLALLFAVVQEQQREIEKLKAAASK